MIKPMFEKRSNKSIIELLKDLLAARLKEPMEEGTLIDEVVSDKKSVSCTTQMGWLNREDLLKFLYVIIYPEILLIDSASKEDLPKLINKNWSVPELKTRYMERMRGER